MVEKYIQFAVHVDACLYVYLLKLEATADKDNEQ